jgi:hypothetical protein
MKTTVAQLVWVLSGDGGAGHSWSDGADFWAEVVAVVLGSSASQLGAADWVVQVRRQRLDGAAGSPSFLFPCFLVFHLFPRLLLFLSLPAAAERRCDDGIAVGIGPAWLPDDTAEKSLIVD